MRNEDARCTDLTARKPSVRRFRSPPPSPLFIDRAKETSNSIGLSRDRARVLLRHIAKCRVE